MAAQRVDGKAGVVLDLTYDFGTQPKHGPYLTFVSAQRLTDDPDHIRHVDYTDFHVSSPSGADPTMNFAGGGVASLRIGSDEHTFTGEQKYRITYTAHGLITRNNATSHLDEINWRIFDNLDVPVNASTIEVDQLRIEEGFDIFSAYLPWAAAFGITEKWTSTSARLETAGNWDPGPTWIPLMAGGFTHDLASTINEMSNSMSASPSSTSSSSSGFSSSSSDSGFGGGGGGSW
ncbi:DUF2207 domain-containing protein [Cutibacterium sp. V947]|uniref:DUF2207 domain-containing protein n=1 Tax=Cutibacterium sp. V947 TaxID=3446480 RepID=UPI003EE25528